MTSIDVNTLEQANIILFDKTTQFNEMKARALDIVTKGMRSNTLEIINWCTKIWNALHQDPQFWTFIDQVFLLCQEQQSKFLALKSVEEQIKSKWALIDSESRLSLRQFIMNQMLTLGATGSTNKFDESLLSQINVVLVHIVKFEWRTTWTTFIQEICDSSQQNQNICENNLKVLKLLSEEIFDFSKNQITSTQITELKASLNSEFGKIFQLCFFLLTAYATQSQQMKLSLIKQNMDTLYTYLSWMPSVYIFQTELVEALIQLFDSQQLKNQAIKCLTEIVSLPLESEPQILQLQQQKILLIFQNFTLKVKQVFSYDYGFVQERLRLKQSQNNTQLQLFDDFCHLLTLYFTTFLQTHLNWLENIAKDNQQAIQLIEISLMYIVNFTALPDEQNYKVCAEFWNEFSKKLLNQKVIPVQNNQLILNIYGGEKQQSLTASVYPKIFVDLRKIIVSKMAKPQEVLISIDESGQPYKEELVNTENNAMYELLKELLINLAKINCEIRQIGCFYFYILITHQKWRYQQGIITIDPLLHLYLQIINFIKFFLQLYFQMDGSEWSFDNLNSICWAIGSLSGCLPEGEEKPFLVQTIKNLLSLCESKKGKENKAVVASNIMYVVGQYPKFLKINWNFLKTVIKKLFEFMNEQFPGVQEMACNTFLTVSKKCGQQFVIDQSASDSTMKEPFIYELIRTLPDFIKILTEHHLLIYIEGLGYMIREDENFERRVQFSIELLKNYQDTYTQYYLIAQQSIDNIREDKFQKFLINYLRISQRAVQPIGFAFYQQLLKMLPTLNEYYALYSQILLQQINNVGIHVLNYFTFKQIRQVRRETLKLYTAFFNASDQKEINSYQNIKEHIVGPICNLLEDYKQCIHEIKEPELLLVFTAMIEKLTTPIQELVPLILANIFQSTISLISQDFNSYPDHRINFFEFLKACVLHHFSALFTMPQDQFRLMIDCIIWAFKHQVPNLQELGLDLMFFILKNLNQSIEIANQFYFLYYKRLLQDIWEILTDSLHTSTFKLQAQILQLLFQVAASPEIVVALDSEQQQQNQSNINHITQYLVVSLSTTFQTISQQQTAVHINRMFQNKDDIAKFRVELSDYLINLRQYAQNNDHLQTSQQTQGQQSID